MFALLDDATGVAYHVVSAIASALNPLTGGLSTALAIVLLTAAVRLAVHPLVRRQMKAVRIRTRLAPQVEKLRKRHRADPYRAQREITALYRAEGTSALAGVGALLLPLPILAVIYRLFLAPTINGHANLLLTHTLLGVPLGERWLLSGALLGPHLWVFLLLFLALAIPAWQSTRIQPPGPPVLRILPFTTLAIAAYVPLAAGLYLLTTTAWTTTERTLLLHH